MSILKKYLYPNESSNTLHVIWSKTPLSKIRICLLICHYFFGYLFIYPYMMAKATLFMNPDATVVSIPVQIVTYLYVFFVSIYLIWPLFKESWTQFPKSFMRVFRIIVGNLILLYGVSVFLNLLIALFTPITNSNNQSQIIQSIGSQRFVTISLALIFAPVVEEVICRGVIFRTLRARWSFLPCALISGAVFGFLHCYSSLLTGDYGDLIFIVVYGMIGVFLCRVYEQSRSLYGAILFHFVYNSVALFLVL